MSAAPDSVTAQVLGHRLKTIADEVEIAMIRASYSSLIKESFDCSAAVVGAAGETWAQADAIPFQTGVLGPLLRRVLEHVPRERLAPGDVLLTNDPALSAPHLNDFVALAPVFAGGEFVAFSCTLMHHADIGGMAPGSMPADATELFQEGVRLPVCHVARAGVLDETVLGFVLANTRGPRAMRGDLDAQLAATQLGVRRLVEAVGELGPARFATAIDAYMSYAERRVRRSIARHLTPGRYTAVRAVESAAGEGADVAQIAVAVTVGGDGDGVTVDFTGTGDQVRRPINVPVSGTIALSAVALACALGGEAPSIGGVHRALRVVTRRGSLLDPAMPAPVGARAIAATLAYDAVQECLGLAGPQRACASSSGGTSMPYTWMATTGAGGGQAVLVDNSLTGGCGARADRDGASGVDNTFSNGMNVPAELLEQDHPVLLERYELRAGSGGAGRFEGGLGVRRAVRFLEDGVLSLRGHRHRYGPHGLLGGESGATTAFWLQRDGERSALPAQASRIPTRAGDVFIAETPGGGGLGDPGERGRP